MVFHCDASGRLDRVASRDAQGCEVVFKTVRYDAQGRKSETQHTVARHFPPSTASIAFHGTGGFSVPPAYAVAITTTCGARDKPLEGVACDAGHRLSGGALLAPGAGTEAPRRQRFISAWHCGLHGTSKRPVRSSHCRAAEPASSDDGSSEYWSGRMPWRISRHCGRPV